MISDEDKIMMETLYWWGIPTLFRCKNDPDPKNCDIALVGIPHSTGNGTTERDQHLGPRAVRNISAMLRRSHFDYKIDPWKTNKIHDLGDVPLPEANDNEKCIERISKFYDFIISHCSKSLAVVDFIRGSPMTVTRRAHGLLIISAFPLFLKRKRKLRRVL